MKYLFFDIECADGNKAICEYGYVLTDEKFNIIRKRNILIDPECPFNLKGRPGQDDLTLTYPYETYYRYYPFYESYDHIKDLMTQQDLLVFGHAVGNDISFLLKDAKRYKLPLFDFVAYDVQKMLPIFNKENKQYTSLEKAYIDLVPENIRSSLLDHRAVDDAVKTMLVFKAMVNNLGFTPLDLIESCPKCKINAIKHFEEAKIHRQERDKRKALEKRNKEGKELWKNLSNEHLSLLDKEESVGKIVTVSSELKAHLSELKELIEYIKNNEYIAYDKVNGSDFLIVYDDNNKKEMESLLKYPYVGKIITLKEFMK